VNVEDKGVYPGTKISPTIYAARNGHTNVLETRLGRGADPNQDDGHGNTCLIASASFAKPECTRLLIQAGGNVQYVYSIESKCLVYAGTLLFRQGTRHVLSWRLYLF
jgi:hypothetical protein